MGRVDFGPQPPPTGVGSQADSVAFQANIGVGDTALHVGVAVLIALAVIIGLHIGGFRFAVDAGVTRS